jgi:DNA-directed RNA polymerase subunit RPC12/RpoP
MGSKCRSGSCTDAKAGYGVHLCRPVLLSASSLRSRGLTRRFQLDCATKNEIRPREPIRCKECGHRIMYKKRTKRSMFSFFIDRDGVLILCSGAIRGSVAFLQACVQRGSRVFVARTIFHWNNHNPCTFQQRVQILQDFL